MNLYEKQKGMMDKMAEQKNYYFRDTREGAKSDEPFAITNADVAKSWKRDFNNDEGFFEPVEMDESTFQINRRDLQQAGLNETPNQITATEHNMELLADEDAANSAYAEMTKKEFVAELEARNLDYKTSGPESTNQSYIKQLMADDADTE